ncbi:hypothetical protein H9Y13_13035 [Aeromonas veronii]|uniref:hypothetical protein n=1 Tax=Aeromonas TaxID=642 RepID=UPI0022EB9975|nr:MULTISPECIES: hypothetical protein [Aeromonas]KAJ8739033.1 hypothetical protein H9Y13_13035 [Aeromonas veronii]MDA3318364.1 hypothetical protein [Aeromonas sp. PI_26]
MNIEQRLQWAERPEGIACFVEGMFVRFYQGQLAWYCQQVKPIKVCTRAVKKLAGQQIYYGGVPKGLFDAWLAHQAEEQWMITHYPWGVWLALPTPLDIPALLAWCAAHAAPPIRTSPKPASASTVPAVETAEAACDTGNQVLQQLRALPLADITPLQALQWLHQWQRQLQPAATPSLLSPAPLERDAAMAD